MNSKTQQDSLQAPTPTQPEPQPSAPSAIEKPAALAAPVAPAPAPKAKEKPAPSKAKPAAKKEQPIAAAPQFEIINLRSNPVRVMYKPREPKAEGVLVVPPGGLRHGEYPVEVLKAPHFVDLTTGARPALKIRQQ